MKLDYRVFGLGALLGLVVAVAPGCGGGQTACNASNCASGCCSAQGTCLTGTTTTACGTGGAACVACSTGNQCVAGACVPVGMGGGTGGGAMGGGMGGGGGGGNMGGGGGGDMDAGMGGGMGGGGGGDMDAGMGGGTGGGGGGDMDAGMGGGGGSMDAGPDVNAQLAAIRAEAEVTDGGMVMLPVDGALVTYVKPAIAGATSDPAGFFLQSQQVGPAVFVAVDPSTLTPAPAVGDSVSFMATSVATVSGMRQVLTLSGWTRNSSGNAVTSLVQNVNALDYSNVTNLNDTESELVTLNGTLTANPASQGAGYVGAAMTTTGTTAGTNLRLRIPATLQDSEDLATGCTVSLNAGPMWRFNNQAQASAWSASELMGTLCPAPQVVSAVAVSATSVRVVFNRNIAPASVAANGMGFTISGGLTVSAATVSAAREVTLTTSAQTGSTSYTVTVASAVTDTRGTGISSTANTATFTGFLAPATVRINEFNANITGSCDLIELRVVAGGSLNGMLLRERDTGSLITFPSVVVATNDLIVVHINSGSATCNPGGAMNETTGVAQFPTAMYGANYDTAWDFYSTDTGLTATDNVFTLYDASNAIVDAVFAADAATGTAAAGTETQAAAVAAAMQWQMVGGGVPMGGFVDDAFRAHAALDLNATGTAASGDSIRRVDNSDDNDKDDWAQGTSSFGAINPGQTPF